MSSLPVLNPMKYDKQFPDFREPTELGVFSLDKNRDYHNDARHLKFLVMPQNPESVKMDLNNGYSSVLKKTKKEEKLDSLLTWILHNKVKVASSFKHSDEKFGPDFVFYRGLFTTLICTIYENKDDWLICASKFNGTIYLYEFKTEAATHRMQNQTEKEDLMTSWGYKFEQYMLADDLHSLPNPDVPNIENECAAIVVKGRLNSHTLLYGAEVDGIDPAYSEKELSVRRYIELKTSRIISNHRQHQSFCRYKSKKWWAQSFLIGIPKVICGFRDDDGIVQFVETYKTSDLPKMSEGFWSASAGMNFCSHFLTFVKNCIKKDDPSVVYQFYWRPGQPVVYEIFTSSEYQILPDWYVQSMNKKLDTVELLNEVR